MRDKVEELHSNEAVWDTIVDLELKSYKKEYLADTQNMISDELDIDKQSIFDLKIK